jgi:hypothetical protein
MPDGLQIGAPGAPGSVLVIEQASPAGIVITDAPSPAPVLVQEPEPAPELVVDQVTGAPGPPGPPGPTGGAPNPIEYSLTSVSNWSQVHAFGYPPKVQVITSSGEQVGMSVTHLDATHVHLLFPQPFTGKVILS